MFHNDILSACSRQRAFRRVQSDILVEYGIEEPDGCGCHGTLEIRLPQIEQSNEKSSIRFGANRKRCRLIRLGWIRFNAWNKLHIVQTELFMESINLVGIFYRVVVDNA